MTIRRPQVSPLTLLLGCFLALVFANAIAESPYAGQQARQIKALSEDEINGYLSGAGMGLAKAAELNRYPGPKHVLELADKLELTDDQKDASQQIFADMQRQASQLGASLVQQEQILDREFARGEINSQSLQANLARIGQLLAAIREAHLLAHLHQKQVLTPDQISRYQHLRGYGDGGRSHDHSKAH